MMPQVSSLRERRRDGSATRVGVTITGDVSPAEQVDVLAAFEELSRDTGLDIRPARCRVEAPGNADRLSNVERVLILQGWRGLTAWAVQPTMPGPRRPPRRRL